MELKEGQATFWDNEDLALRVCERTQGRVGGGGIRGGS